MAMTIDKDECISCGSCETECPTDSITSGLFAFEIDPETCTECQGAADAPQCVEACPVSDCITKAD
ncbi:MAG: 4Fe-4S binding protein [Planctomycetota bacterium]